jgi:aldose 1-epimerase
MANDTGWHAATLEGTDVHLRDTTGAIARIQVAFGNNICDYRVRVPGRADPVAVLVTPDALGGYSYGNPILFPFPNRVKGGTYTFEGVTHHLDVNETSRGNHIHGLVNRRPWVTEAVGADDVRGAWHRASVDLASDPEIQRQYPFGAKISVTTSLHDGVLVQVTVVENHGSGRLPMGYGIHPWFPVTLGGTPREASRVRVPGAAIWELDNLVPTGQLRHVDGTELDLREWPEIATRELDHVYTAVERRSDGWTDAGVIYPDENLRLLVEASPEFREWVIFAPPFRPVVCLEPYTGTTNAVNLQNEGIDAGLVVIEPGSSWKGEVRFSLRPA